MEDYFAELEREVMRTYDIAERCRSKGFDIDDHVEIPIAKDLPDRVEQLVGPPGIAQVIRDLDDGNRESTAIRTSVAIAKGSNASTERAIDQAVRTGLAILTEGILVAPLEGIASVYLGRNSDGTSYLGIKFSGPIRSAGGTGQALSVLIGDMVRRELGIGSYRATEAEVQRYKEEIPLYKRSVNLQYLPSDNELDIIVRNCPVCIDGEPTEKIEVSGQRDLPRIDTNRVRGGMCLVLSEGIALKASKILKNVSALGIEGWEFLEEFTKGARSDGKTVGPSEKYMKDLIVGRPVFSHPSRKGGFRLRYGRARTTGLAAIALNPATMIILGNFLALGTQMKIERPGKAGAITSCTTIEGPTVLLKNGDVVRVDDQTVAASIAGNVSEIIDVGEVLIPFGEFVENNHPLVPGAYSIERWAAELLAETGGDFRTAMDAAISVDLEGSVELSRKHGLPLHPSFNLQWHDITIKEVRSLGEAVRAAGAGVLSIPNDPGLKGSLEELACPHRVDGDRLILDDPADVLRLLLGKDVDPGTDKTVIEYLSRASGITIPHKCPTRIGGRMGRPEKAAPRMMKPPVHGLFPLGQHGGSQRLLSKASEAGAISVKIGARKCEVCETIGFRRTCCGKRTLDMPVMARKIDVGRAVSDAVAGLGIGTMPPMKGVKGLISEGKVPEPIEKGILRSMHGVFVNKDGTVRFEYMDTPLTHFKPKEIGTTVEKLKDLGYADDIAGKPLESDDQILELRVQDFIPSQNGGEYMVNVAKFVDDLLKRFYDEDPFYRASEPGDLVGQLVVGLAPHTSGGVLGRIIGFTPTHCGFAHPFYHAAKRRNCDGDADTFFLLLDGLLNFSRSYLPSSRGGQMDAPLVMPIRIDPDEIDKEALNVDAGWFYPAEFYEAADNMADPKDVAPIMSLVKDLVKEGNEFSGFGFTHDTEDLTLGPKNSAYGELGSITDKLNAQMELAVKIRAVDESDVATRLIEGHLLPDIMGNLRTFCQQSFRCAKCNSKYRRLPLSGKCTRCGNKLILTVHEGNVTKYIDMAKEIAEKYHVSPYVAQRLEMLDISIRTMFDGNNAKKKNKKEKPSTCLEDYL